MGYKKKNPFEKAFNRKLGGMKRSANAQMKKDLKNSGCGTLLGWLFLIFLLIGVVSMIFG